MNAPFFAAGAVAAFAAVLHGVGGEWAIASRLAAAAMPASPAGDGDVLRRYLRGCWHFVTVDFAIAALTLFQCALAPEIEGRAALGRLVALHFAVYLAVYAVLVASRPRLLLTVPQWPLILAVAALAWRGAAAP